MREEEKDFGSARSAAQELARKLPEDVRPHPYSGFAAEPFSIGADPELGWSYDWIDKGADPPPWSDWRDKDV